MMAVGGIIVLMAALAAWGRVGRGDGSSLSH